MRLPTFNILLVIAAVFHPGMGAALSQVPQSIAIDFSHCGYRGALHPLPGVPAKIFVPRGDGDATHRLQAAIEEIARKPLDGDGFRGAVLLEAGEYSVAGQLRINASGIVLRGVGAGTGGTVLRATGPGRRPLIRILGAADRQIDPSMDWSVAQEGVAAGATRIPLRSTAGLDVGDPIVITRPSSREWIEALGMDRFLVAWKPGSRDLQWERRITAVDGNRIGIDAPITMAMEERFGGGRVARLVWPGRIERIGIEQLCLESVVPGNRPREEEHAWVGITLENVRDAWVRQVTFRKFAGSAVLVWESARNVTVQDCLALEPVSEIGGHRRRTFFTAGEQTLFLRCWSERGIHDFTVGHCAAGPNAFVACESARALGNSGSLGSWASGVLYDNVNIDGAALRLDNKWVDHQGAGWSAANSVLWQCSAAEIHCYRPPTATNTAVGVWGRYFGDGDFSAVDEFVRPESLFRAQLSARSAAAAARLGPIGRKAVGATSPTYTQAEDFVSQSNRPQQTLRQVIENAPSRDPIPSDPGGVPTLADGKSRASQRPPGRAIAVLDGWIATEAGLATGKLLRVPWWRGTIRPGEAAQLGPAITRFVPGRIGLGFTDDLEQLTRDMVRRGVVALEHNYGLWYDRRRDDHQRVRRADGAVSAPFYEQPFARSGQGTAWDGLSRYDLERPNLWYWDRLKQFADLADTSGLVLYHQHYFQHNLLEAGAHWADSPWRTANNVNGTGFPEPPPYIGDKRIFQAHLFYDVSHQRRRELHRQYIEQCLGNFAGNTNVIHLTGAEYTGPLDFVQFWIDVAMDWEKTTENDALLGLSCTKDVQDAILQDPVRGKAISVIDIRYWHYTKEGELYAPEGGKNLAPRQHARQLRPRSASFDSIIRAVREYRLKYPDKAVVSSLPGDGWAVLMGGGSLPAVPALPPDLRAAIPGMRPGRMGGSAALGDAQAGHLIAAPELVDAVPAGNFTRHWIDRETGSEVEEGAARALLWLRPRED